MPTTVLSTDLLDVALDVDGDILIDAEGLHFVSGIEGIAQLVRIACQLYLGEWFLNMDIGVPYYEEILGDASLVPGVEARARASLAAAILGVPGVTGITQLSVVFDHTARKLTATIQAATQLGDTPVDLLVMP